MQIQSDRPNLVGKTPAQMVAILTQFYEDKAKEKAARAQ